MSPLFLCETSDHHSAPTCLPTQPTWGKKIETHKNPSKPKFFRGGMDVPKSHTNSAAVCSLLDQLVFHQRTAAPSDQQRRKRRRLVQEPEDDEEAAIKNNKGFESPKAAGASLRKDIRGGAEDSKGRPSSSSPSPSSRSSFRSPSPNNNSRREEDETEDEDRGQGALFFPPRLNITSPSMSGAETGSTATATPPPRKGWLQKARVRREEAVCNNAAAGLIVSVISSPTARKRLGTIHFERYRDLTFQHPHESRVTALQFVNGDVAYSTGIDKCIKLYHLSPTEQTIQHTVHVKNTPIYASCLSSTKQSIISVSDQGKMFTLDLASRSVSKCPMIPGIGKDSQALKQIQARDSILSALDDRGRIYLLDERTYKTIKIFNSGTSIKSMVMTDNRIYAGDDGGELFEWDLRLGRCSNRHVIEGSLGVRCLGLASNGRLVAGTKSGYVSLYDLEPSFQLVKSFGNLCTSTDVICPALHSPMVLGGSSKDQDAVRLFNVGETPFVYQNFPGEHPRINHITTAAFSETNGWMAIGNDRGIVKLWRLPSSSL